MRTLISILIALALVAPIQPDTVVVVGQKPVVGGGSLTPSVVDYQESNWADSSSASEVTPSVTWQSGDKIFVVGVTEEAENFTLGTPTATGLTFSLVTSVAGINNCGVLLWEADAGSSSSGAITSTAAAGGAGYRGIAAIVWRNHNGRGTPATITGSTAKTISLTRASPNSGVLVVFGDWNAVSDTTVTASPSTDGTVRKATAAANMSGYIVTWVNQGAAGTTSYGIANHTGTVDMSGIVVEIKGT